MSTRKIIQNSRTIHAEKGYIIDYLVTLTDLTTTYSFVNFTDLCTFYRLYVKKAAVKTKYLR